MFLQVSEMAVSELPGNPNAVWTVKVTEDGLFLFVSSYVSELDSSSSIFS